MNSNLHGEPTNKNWPIRFISPLQISYRAVKFALQRFTVKLHSPLVSRLCLTVILTVLVLCTNRKRKVFKQKYHKNGIWSTLGRGFYYIFLQGTGIKTPPPFRTLWLFYSNTGIDGQTSLS